VGSTNRDELDRLSYLMSAGVVRLCEALVPAMVQRGCGEVVVVSSIASFTPMRKAGPYAAAKSAATAYARSLALEVGDKGVRVVAVCPGYVHTDLHHRAGLAHLTTKVPEWMWLEPIDVVLETRRALARGKSVVVPGVAYRLVRPFLASSLAQSVWRRLTRR
jgi:short-subunit dehydrogenase